MTRTDAPHPAPFSNNSNRCEALNVLSSLLRWRSRRLCSRPRGWRRSMQRHPKRTTRFGPDAPNFQCWRHSRLDSRPTKSNAGDARVEICLAQSAAQDRYRCGNRTHRTTGTRGHANKRTRYRPQRRRLDAAQQAFVWLSGTTSRDELPGRFDDETFFNLSRSCRFERTVQTGELLGAQSLDIQQTVSIDVENRKGPMSQERRRSIHQFHDDAGLGQRAVRQSREHGRRLRAGSFS